MTLQKKAWTAFLFIISAALLLTLIFSPKIFIFDAESGPIISKEDIKPPKPAREELKAARNEYFFRMLRNPKTNRIPSNIRDKELDFAKSIPRKVSNKAGAGQAQTIESIGWQEVGPNNVGGRTRALGVDVDDPNTIIAGGVSGGIWKSTDNGASWESKNTTNDRLSVTWLVQDTTSTNNDTWYYATGEFSGNSAGGNGAPYQGYGIFVSTDNGETWNLLNGTGGGDDSVFNSQYDFVSRLAINPTTGSLFMASNVGGVYKYNGVNSFDLSLGGFADHRYVDITANSNGNLIAVLSENGYGGTSTNSPGVYLSTDDGASWTDITPGTFPSEHDRSFAAFAPSAPDTAYIISYLGLKANTSPNDSVAFHLIDLNSGGTVQTEDRSANMPDFGDPVGEINQSNYDMILTVKPDDSDFVLLGFTNIYRSRDGFKTPATNQSDVWIGGYATINDVSQYANHHPDQHSIAFDPTNPNRMWSGHDGGLSYTTDITVNGPVTWQNKNNGYNVTQFYDVSIPDGSGDQRVMGGTQDNGTPIFFTNVDGASQADASTGDGAFSYFGDNYLYSSFQNGVTRRFSYNPNGLGGFSTGNFTNFTNVYPPLASDQLFINPSAIDPNDETIIYYPAGDDLWRNKDIEDLNVMSGFVINDWEQLTMLSPSSGSIISAMEASQSNPAHRLYYAAFIDGAVPEIYRIDNANVASNTSGNLTDISISGVPSDAYIANLAVNPDDADELIAVMSNYDIVGLYHSDDGGSTWTAIEGNLQGGGGSSFGPSLRDAAIIPLDTETLYVLATSTGVYSTKTLNGGSTTWSQEGASTIGNVVSVSLAHRTSDNTLVIGTHGRGIFGKIPREREIAGNVGWRMMSAAVEDMPISDITDNAPIQGFGDGFDKNFYTGYDGTNFTAPANLSGNLTSGEGFILYFFDNAQAGSSPLPFPISSTGSEPSGNVVVNLHASGDRFNLVGNPYNAAIDFDALTLNEVENAWWVWDNATSQYLTYNGATGVTETNNDGRIAPWQGFWVRSDNGATSPSVTFTQDAKSHYDANFYKNNNPENVRTIRFKVAGNGLTDNNTVAVFYEGGKIGDDPGDMEDLAPLSSEYVNLSFIKPESDDQFPLTNDARAYNISGSEKFNLDLKSSGSGSFTLDWELDNIPGEWTLELYDRKTEEVVYLNGATNYTFEAKPSSSKRSKELAKLASVQPGKESGETVPRFELTVKKGTVTSGNKQPISFVLNQNYPNPFNPTTSIPYEVPVTSNIKLEIYNSIGQKVITLVDEQKAAGFYRTQFDASRFASGVYFIRLKANNFVQVKPMTLIK